MNGNSTDSLFLWRRLQGWVERRPRAALTLIVLLAVILRSAAIYYAAPPDHVYGTELANIAKAILSGRGIADAYGTGSGPTAHGSPVYPVLLAGLYWAFGFGYWGAPVNRDG